MEFLEKGKRGELWAGLDQALYQALAIRDLPAAWLLTKPVSERADFERLSAPTAFNCGLCLYRLEEYEKALTALRRAEQAFGNAPELDIREKELFFQALKMSEDVYLRPLNPETGKCLERYGLIKTRWLTALCLLQLNRPQEAAPAIRFLAQYHIEINAFR